MFVRQNRGAFGYVCLSRHPVRQAETAALRPLFDGAQDRRIVVQFQAEQVGRDFTRDVVGRRSEPTRDEDDLSRVQRFLYKGLRAGS